MNRIIILFLLSLLSWASATLLPAQPASPRKSTSGRFLLVVDTSFSMGPQKAVLCITAHDLIYSGIRNQMKPGDTFSVWTFNQDTDTQQFPLLDWNPELKLILANQVAAFLNNQPFQKISRLDKALPEILGLTRDSRKLTVLILSDGLEFFQGTPFDVRINEVYRERSRELRQAGKPFITVLEAMNGQIVGWSVSAAGEPIQISQLQASFQSAPAAATSEVFNSGPVQPGSAKAPNPAVARPNLIVRSVRQKDQASSSSPAANENAGTFGGSSEKMKLQLRLPPQSVEPDSSRLNLGPGIVVSGPVNSSARSSTSAGPIEDPSATSAIAIPAPVPAQSAAVKLENSSPAIPQATPTATRLETSFCKPESCKPSELVSAALTPSSVPAPIDRTEQGIAPSTEIQAPLTPPPTASSLKNTPAQPKETANQGSQIFATTRQSVGESPSARGAVAPGQAAASSLVKIKRDPAIEKSIPATLHPLSDVPSAANGKAPEQVLPRSDSPTGAQVAVLGPRASYQFNWGYFALGLTTLITALALIYILTRRLRAPQRSSLISRSIERK